MFIESAMVYSSEVKKKGRYLIVIFILFFASLVVRFPHMKHRLYHNYEWVTAQTLIALENLDSQGAFKHRFCILQTYPLEADKYVKNVCIHLMDRNGNGYYPSFPPFSVIFPYMIFKLFSININVTNLQILNLIFHLVATVFVYHTICMVLSPDANPKFAALLGSTFFIFLAPNLWFFSNTYSWDIFWHYIWVIGIYYAVRLIKNISEKKFNNTSLYVLGLINFFMIYAEYQGLLYALSVISYAFIKLKKAESYKKVIFTLVVTSMLSVSLTFWQYCSISGVDRFLHILNWTLRRRSILGQFDYRDIFLNYQRGFFYVLPPIVLMMVILVKKRLGRLSTLFTGRELTLLYFSALPVVTHHIMLMQWTAIHDYSVLKSSVFVSFLIAILFSKIDFYCKRNKVCLLLPLVFMMGSLITSIHTYKSKFANHGNPNRFYEIGKTIRENALDDEVVFALSEERTVPQIIYYAHRNIQPVKSSEEVETWLRQHGRNKGVVFHIDQNDKIVNIEKVRL